MSIECRAFIGKCLCKDPEKRLGSVDDVWEVLGHPWFKSLDVGDLLGKKIEAPFVPGKK